jgi:hypothetical protein
VRFRLALADSANGWHGRAFFGAQLATKPTSPSRPRKWRGRTFALPLGRECFFGGGRQGRLFLLRVRLGLLLLLGGLLMRLGRRWDRAAFHFLRLRESFGGQSLELFGIVTRPTLARLERQRE